MNFHQLEVFAAVVEKGGFTRAADALFLTQSTVSTQVRRLEKNLGMPLFRRVRGDIALTDAGELVYRTAHTIQVERTLLEEKLSELATGEGGHVAVGVSQTGAMYGVFEAVQAYRQSRPKVQVEVHVVYARTLLDALLDGRLDFGIEWGPGRYPPQIEPITLKRYDFLLLASPTAAITQHPYATPELFRQEPLLTLQYGPDEIGVIEMELLRRRLLPDRITRLPSIDAVKRMTEANLGVTVLSSLSVAREIGQGTLVAVPFPALDYSRPLELWRVSHRYQSPAVTDCLDFITAWPPWMP